MNYFVVYKAKGVLTSLFFYHRDESDPVYRAETLIRNEDDVINVMREWICPDNDAMVIRETLLDFSGLENDIPLLMEHLRRYLDE